MNRRLVLGIGANLYGQAVTVAVQLCTVPAFLHLWGADRFGRWLTLLAWTSILSLADGGVMIAGGTAMTAAVARGEAARAGRIFLQATRLVVVIAIVACGAAALMLAVLPTSLLGGDTASVGDTRAAAIALSVAALAGLPLGMAELGFRAAASYAAGLVGTSSVRLLETGAALAVAASGTGLAAAAVALLAVRLCGASALLALLRRRAAWVASARSDWTWDAIRPVARPALAALALPAGLALSLQGTTAAAGFVLSAGAVAALVAARTLTRVLVQGIGLVTHALMPEMTMAAGQGDERRVIALVRLNLGAAAAVLLPGWVVLVTVGPALMERWTGGVLRPDPVVMALMASAAVLHGGWLSLSNLLLATNRQGEYAYHAVAIGALTCGLTLILGRAWGLEGAAAAGLAGECAMALVVVPAQVSAAFRPSTNSRSAEARP